MFWLFHFFRFLSRWAKAFKDHIKWQPEKSTKAQHGRTCTTIIRCSHNGRTEGRWPAHDSPCHCDPFTAGHCTERCAGGGTCSLESIDVVVGLPSDQGGYCPSLSAHLSHLITLRLCLSVLVSLATCLQQWRELWPQHGRSTVRWRGKARAREIEGGGKLAERPDRKGERKERVAVFVVHRCVSVQKERAKQKG